MNFIDWQAAVRSHHPTARFTLEDGSGRTYGEEGEWTAHTGPDMQAHVVGTYVPGVACTVYEPNVEDFVDYPAA